MKNTWISIFIIVIFIIIFLFVELSERAGFKHAFENCINYNKTLSVEEARTICNKTIYNKGN